MPISTFFLLPIVSNETEASNSWYFSIRVSIFSLRFNQFNRLDTKSCSCKHFITFRPSNYPENYGNRFTKPGFKINSAINTQSGRKHPQTKPNRFTSVKKLKLIYIGSATEFTLLIENLVEPIISRESIAATSMSRPTDHENLGYCATRAGYLPETDHLSDMTHNVVESFYGSDQCTHTESGRDYDFETQNQIVR